MLTKEEKKELLKIARDSIDYYFKGLIYQPTTIFKKIKKPQGAFVTLKINDGLRGCIGILETKEPLYKVVSTMSLSAAFADTRFLPLTQEEFERTIIEISALSPLKKIKDPYRDIKIGEHGVMIKSTPTSWRRGSGVFLPQVAVETNWGLEEFLNELCKNKASLPPDTWKKGEVDIYVFTAEVFSEKNLIKDL